MRCFARKALHWQYVSWCCALTCILVRQAVSFVHTTVNFPLGHIFPAGAPPCCTFTVENSRGYYSSSASPPRCLSYTSTRTRSITRHSSDSTPQLVMASTIASMSAASRRVGKIMPGNAVFFACDIQERFRDVIHNMPGVISTARWVNWVN